MPAATPRAGKERSRRRLRGGLIAAYTIVVGLIVASGVLVLGFGGTPLVAEPAGAAAPEPPPAQTAIVSLKLPPRIPPSGFRDFTPDELADMTEITADGLRLPKVSSTGWMPWIAHSRRFDPAGPPARIGLLMINVGANEALMKRAIEDLPGDVSLAFLPGTPDLLRWLRLAREHGHESYLMLPVEDPNGPAERGIRPIETAADSTENLRRLRAAMARGEGYVGLVMPSPSPVTQSEQTVQPLLKEISDRGLALIEINPSPGTAAIHRLTGEIGVGYARSDNVLDYKLAGDGVAGNLERLVAWTGETGPDRMPRHAFGVVQPEEEAIDAIVAWRRRAAEQPAVSLVPIIGHFECREACMARVRAQPAQLRP